MLIRARPLCMICHYLQEKVNEKYPSARHTAIGGFIFLRFLNPAINLPEAYGLTRSEYKQTNKQKKWFHNKIDLWTWSFFLFSFDNNNDDDDELYFIFYWSNFIFHLFQRFQAKKHEEFSFYWPRPCNRSPTASNSVAKNNTWPNWMILLMRIKMKSINSSINVQ